MPLKLELKAGERVLLGDFVVVNEGGRTRLCIEGDAPVLRERDLLMPEAASSLAERLYLAIQSMYLSRDTARYLADYQRLAREIAGGEPATRPFLDAIDHSVAAGHLYKAMRVAQRLIRRDGQPALSKLAKAG